MTLKVEPINFYMSEKQLTQAFYCRTLSLYCIVKNFGAKIVTVWIIYLKLATFFTKSCEI